MGQPLWVYDDPKKNSLFWDIKIAISGLYGLGNFQVMVNFINSTFCEENVTI